MNDVTTGSAIALPIYAPKSGAGRPKLQGSFSLQLSELTDEQRDLFVRVGVRLCWADTQYYNGYFDPEKYPQSLIVRQLEQLARDREAKAVGSQNPGRALAAELCSAYGVKTPAGLPAGPAALIAAVAAGCVLDDPRITKAITALSAKFPNSDWAGLVEGAIKAQAAVLADADF